MNEKTINFDILERSPLVIIISGPSGVGKDAVLRALKRSDHPIYHVVTMNTRSPRPGEKEGVDYFFVSRQKFEEMIEQDAFIEYSNVYEDYKGVPKAQIRKALASGKDVILRLDVQGAEKIKRLVPSAILIFLVPSNQEEWSTRLGGRHKTDKDMETRIKTAREELAKAMDFDYVVTNAQNKLDETVQTIEAILTAEHQKAAPRKIDI